MNAEKRRGNFEQRKAQSIAKREANEAIVLSKQAKLSKAKIEAVSGKVIMPRRRGKSKGLVMDMAAIALMHVPNGMR